MEKDAAKRAKKIARLLMDEKINLSHARRIDAKDLKNWGARIEILEEQDENIQDAVRQLHFAIMTTLDETGLVKIFENSVEAALIRMVNIQVNQPKKPSPNK